MPSDAIAAARAMCDRYPGGIPAVAALMGLAPGVLYNKLSGDDAAHHKLTVRDCLLIYAVTREIDHLQALARTMNCVAFQVPEYQGLSDQALLDLVCRINKEGGQFHAALERAIADGKIDQAEYKRLRAEAFEWIGAIAEADRRLEGMVNG